MECKENKEMEKTDMVVTKDDNQVEKHENLVINQVASTSEKSDNGGQCPDSPKAIDVPQKSVTEINEDEAPSQNMNLAEAEAKTPFQVHVSDKTEAGNEHEDKHTEREVTPETVITNVNLPDRKLPVTEVMSNKTDPDVSMEVVQPHTGPITQCVPDAAENAPVVHIEPTSSGTDISSLPQKELHMASLTNANDIAVDHKKNNTVSTDDCKELTTLSDSVVLPPSTDGTSKTDGIVKSVQDDIHTIPLETTATNKDIETEVMDTDIAPTTDGTVIQTTNTVIDIAPTADRTVTKDTNDTVIDITPTADRTVTKDTNDTVIDIAPNADGKVTKDTNDTVIDIVPTADGPVTTDTNDTIIDIAPTADGTVTKDTNDTVIDIAPNADETVTKDTNDTAIDIAPTADGKVTKDTNDTVIDIAATDDGTVTKDTNDTAIDIAPTADGKVTKDTNDTVIDIASTADGKVTRDTNDTVIDIAPTADETVTKDTNDTIIDIAPTTDGTVTKDTNDTVIDIAPTADETVTKDTNDTVIDIATNADDTVTQATNDTISDDCNNSSRSSSAISKTSMQNKDGEDSVIGTNTDSNDGSQDNQPAAEESVSKILPRGVVMLDINDDSSMEGLTNPFNLTATSGVDVKDLLSQNRAPVRSESSASITSSLVQCEDSNMSVNSEVSKEGLEESTDNGKDAETVKDVKKKAPIKRRQDLTLGELTGGHKEDGLTAEHLYEYRWPQEPRTDWYMIQEQVSEFLGVKSFKRKYPDLERRNIDPRERVFLREKGVVTEMQADLGLTAVRADLVHDLMSKDYPLKYKEYIAVLKERKRQQAAERQREIQAQRSDKTRLEQLRQKAMKSSALFNSMLNRERKEDRRAYFDVHTFEIQFPRDPKKVLPPEATTVGPYPVALIPGQFQDYYKRYSSQEMKYLPLNTSLYSSPRKQNNIYADPEPGSDAEEVSTESSEQSVSEESEAESVEIASDMFEEQEDEVDNDEETGSQVDPGKTKEEKKQEIDRKVQEILTKLNYKESRKGKRGRPRLTDIAKYFTTPKKRKAGDAVEEESPDMPSVEYKPLRPPRKRKVKEKEVIHLCNICGGTQDANAMKQPEDLVQCSVCHRYGHPSCLELTLEMIDIIKTYPWQCMECKTCIKCKDSQHEDKMLFCDHCDRGYHTFCVGLQAIPNGRWECPSCRPPPPSPEQQQQPVEGPGTSTVQEPTLVDTEPSEPTQMDVQSTS